MCGNMQHFIYWAIDSFCLDMCDVTHTSSNQLYYHFPLFFIYCLPHHLFYLDMCDVTIYVTPTVGSLTYTSNIRVSLDHVTTFIMGNNISVVLCKDSFIRLQTHIASGYVMLRYLAKLLKLSLSSLTHCHISKFPELDSMLLLRLLPLWLV